MHLTRQRFLAAAAAACLLPLPLASLAQGAYPSRPISLVVPTATGGTTDLSARMLAQPLGVALGQSLVVENKGGGNGAIAAAFVKRAEPDGYTLLMQYSGYHVITPVVSKTPLPWAQKDLRPVANVLSAPQIIVVRADLPVKTMADLVAYAKAHPGKLNYASSGNGSLQHVTGAMLEQQAGVQMVHVPYKGTGPALQDLLGGQVDLTFGTAPPFMPHIQAGKLRVLAVTGASRLPSLPDVPSTAEAGFPKLDASSWFAVFAPAATPDAMVQKLAGEIGRVVNTPAFRKLAQDQGATADFQDPAQLAARVTADLARWSQLAKTARIEVD